MLSSEGATPLSLKQRQRQEREALILQIAEEVLMEKGYYETSIDEIASRVGVSKGTIYLHFASKEDLTIAILIRDIQQLIEQVQAAIATGGSVQSRLERVLQIIYGNFARRTQLITGLLHSANHRQLKEQGKQVIGLWEGLAEHLSNLLEEGKASGEITHDIPTYIMVRAFFGFLSLGNFERLKIGENVSPDELAHYLGRIYCRGVVNA